MEYGIVPRKRETEMKRTRTRVSVLVYKKIKVLELIDRQYTTSHLKKEENNDV